MRIIAGEFKGRRLKSPKGMDTRPTTDRVRESIFAILGDIVPGAKVLDAFAGTGAMGLEALSRGASHAVFVDASAAAARVVRDNVEACGAAGVSEVLRMDIRKALSFLARGSRRFDLVFVDPPYMTGLAQRTLADLDELKMLDTMAIAVVEHSRREEIPAEVGGFSLARRERYGDTMVSFYRYAREVAVHEDSGVSGEF